MDIAYQVATVLVNSGFGSLGTDIFVGQIPEDTNGIWLEQIGGQLNNYVPIEEAAVNIYVKNTNAQEGIDTISSIKNFIHRMHSTTLSDAYIYTFLVIGNIEDVQRDVEYAKIFKLTVQVVYRDTAVIS